VVTDARGNIVDGKPAARAGRNTAPSGLGPADLQDAYNVSPTAGSGTYTIAIVDAYGYANAEADLAVYRS
jgi:subtilase family serine protease